MGKKLKFRLSERKESICQYILTEVLPVIESEWISEEYDTENGKRSRYETTLGNVKLRVSESEVRFLFKNKKDKDGSMTTEKILSEKSPNGKPKKSRLFSMVEQRFKDDEDIIFFRGLSEHLVETYKIGMEETDLIDNEHPVYLTERPDNN